MTRAPSWAAKARVQRVLARLPAGARAYVGVQRRFGNLSADPDKRVGYHLRMLRLLHEAGLDLTGARVLEVGTGHHPTVPILFHLVGAGEIVTVDLHRRLQQGDVVTLVRRLAATESDLADTYKGLTDTGAMRARLRDLAEVDDASSILAHAGIRYAAPADAGAMPDAAGSFDLHVSTTVLEHVEPSALAEIAGEAARLLRPGGAACHLVDPSDHFAHGDPSISRINFLRFSDAEWQALAGNQFGYHNRLRAPELVDAFEAAGLDVVSAAGGVDERSLADLAAGFRVDARFRRFSPQELATTTLDLLAVRR